MSASHPPIVERIETAIRDTTAERSPKRYDALMRDALAALTEAQQRIEAIEEAARWVVDERTAAEAEVARLTAENATLRRQAAEDEVCPCTDHYIAPYCPFHGG